MLLFATICATSLGGLVMALRFPTGADGFTYATAAEDADALGVFLLAAGVNLAVGIGHWVGLFVTGTHPELRWSPGWSLGSG